MAKFLHLPHCHSKENLARSIIDYYLQKHNLSAAMEAEQSSFSSPTTFRKNKNTFPRLCNFLFEDPDALAISKLLSTRDQLQQREYNQNNPVYTNAVSKFNDYSFSSGGLVTNHQILMDRKVDPDEVNSSGLMSIQYAYQYFRNVVDEYALVVKNYSASGQHLNDIWTFCKNDPDILYLHLWLEKLNHPNLQRFCAEGAELPHIYDSGAPTRSIIVPEPVSTSKKKNDPIVELVSYFKEAQENRKRKAEAFELAASAATTAPCTSSSSAQSINDLFKLADDADERIQKLVERERLFTQA
jgi:hypothetical protein